MEIVRFKTVKAYRRQVARFYQTDPCFKDNKSGLLSLVCNPKGAFYALTEQEMLGVRSGGRVACVAVLIHHQSDPEHLMLAFFECHPGCGAAAAFLVGYANEFGRSRGCNRLIASLDGHCNNSVGFLARGEGAPGFGQSYNPLFYNEIFRELGFSEHRLVSFWEEIPALRLRLFEVARRLLPKDIEIAPADFSRSGFRQSMKDYTKFSNAVFHDHRYCFDREEQEDYELFASMRPLLDGDNLLFARRGGAVIGMLFWYPDFNQLVPPRGGAGVLTFLKYRALGRAPDTVKAVQIGVLPEYENSGLILALFGAFYSTATQKHRGLTTCVSSWILEENSKSVTLSSKILPRPYKEMSAYEKSI